ncbi:MAG: hypothetical protein ACKVP3_17090 [Hyphomicrobiaceae bacterium]
MTQKTLSLVLALVCGLHAVSASGQACSVRDFTFREVEKISFSDVIRHAGFSLARPDKTEQRKNEFEGSAAIYGVPDTLQYDEARALSDFMLRSSGFAVSQELRLDLVRTALSKTGAEMYKDCVAAKSIRIAVPDAAYTEQNFDLTVSWTPTSRAPETAEFEIRVLGGRVQGKGGVAGTMKKGVTMPFDIQRSTNGLLQIEVIVHGQALPPVLLPPPNKAMATFKTEKRAGKSQKPFSGPGNECGDQAHLVSEDGTAAKANSKSCRLCVAKSPNGFLLVSSAKADGQFSGAGKVALELNSPLQMCALFSVEGRGKKGGRQEVQNGMFHVWEMVPSQ